MGGWQQSSSGQHVCWATAKCNAQSEHKLEPGVQPRTEHLGSMRCWPAYMLPWQPPGPCLPRAYTCRPSCSSSSWVAGGGAPGSGAAASPATAHSPSCRTKSCTWQGGPRRRDAVSAAKVYVPTLSEHERQQLLIVCLHCPVQQPTCSASRLPPQPVLQLLSTYNPICPDLRISSPHLVCQWVLEAPAIQHAA